MSNTKANAILALQEAVSGILKVALQNQLAFDVMLASQCDVCILINATCCTYIDQSGRIATDISTTRKNLQVLHKVEEWEWKGDWWRWLPGTGGWFGNIFRSVLKWTVILLLIIIIAYALMQFGLCCLKMGCKQMKKETKGITQSEAK